jgi:hypothetical protein
MTETASQPTTGDIVAKHSRSYRLKWVIMGIALLAASGWFAYDGYVGYPKENKKAHDEAIAQGKAPPEKVHQDFDIVLQKRLAFGLIPAGLFVMGWGLYHSRGEYRLAGNTLHVPGHPPVPLDAIRAIDQSKWERKGIAYIDYELDGKTATLKLDDYTYERDPTDQIHERILKTVAPEEATAESSSSTSAE